MKTPYSYSVKGKRYIYALLLAALYAGSAMAVLLPFAVHPAFQASETPGSLLAPAAHDVLADARPALPGILEDSDAGQYHAIFLMQDRGEWAEADRLIRDLHNRMLMGHVFAQRFLSKDYKPTFSELNQWLNTYADHPQAPEIFRLAVAKRRASDQRLAEVPRRPMLLGYGDDNGLGSNDRRTEIVEDQNWEGREEAKKLWHSIHSSIQNDTVEEAEARLYSPNVSTTLQPLEFDASRLHLASRHLYRGNSKRAYGMAAASASRSGTSIPAAHWVAGIAAWQMKDTRAAASHFRRMADAEKGLSSWEISASSFWTWRALTKQGQSKEAARYLARAAEHPRTFYGLLARKVQGVEFSKEEDQIPELSSNARETLYSVPAIQRAVALAQAQEETRAEQELRAQFPQETRDVRVQLLSLAHALNLPAVQISMAKALEKSGLFYHAALYPKPNWRPLTGFAVDPALVFAFVRQESGFHPAAKAKDGGMGLMQLMPGTAKLMQRATDMDDMAPGSIYTPEANMALGQSYLDHLMRTDMVKDNLIFLAAAYNAGPGRIVEWKKTIQDNGDPLLFVESIPFNITRNYVQQVLTSYWLYHEIEGRQANSAHQLAHGQWPRYDAAPVRVADVHVNAGG